jgi:hypothetical protein
VDGGRERGEGPRGPDSCCPCMTHLEVVVQLAAAELGGVLAAVGELLVPARGEDWRGSVERIRGLGLGRQRGRANGPFRKGSVTSPPKTSSDSPLLTGEGGVKGLARLATESLVQRAEVGKAAPDGLLAELQARKDEEVGGFGHEERGGMSVEEERTR